MRKKMLGDIGPSEMILIYLAFAMGLANVFLLLRLINSYWKTYKIIKSQFTIGLLYFATFLLIQNILVTISIAIPIIVNLVPFRVSNSEFGPQIILVIVNMIQLVALTILYKINKN